MASAFLAVQTALLSLLSTYLPELPETCPTLVEKPTKRVDDTPHLLMNQLREEVQHADEGEGADLLFYGDSITESWRGTDMGRPSVRNEGAPEVFQVLFGSKYSSQVLAVGGDQVAHLHWRLLNGNIPSQHKPAVAVILIGINDLLMGHYCWPHNEHAMAAIGNVTALKITRMLDELFEQLPTTRVLLLSILPAGDWTHPNTTYAWPNALTPGIETANKWLAEAAESEDRLDFLDCGGPFLVNGKIDPAAQSDGLHPSHIGFDLLARCIEPWVDALMGMQKVGRSHHRRWPVMPAVSADGVREDVDRESELASKSAQHSGLGNPEGDKRIGSHDSGSKPHAQLRHKKASHSRQPINRHLGRLRPGRLHSL